MTDVLDATHDPARRSWVEPANASAADFPLQNLPLGVGARPGERPRIVVAIGDAALPLADLADRGLLAGPAADAVRGETLNALMALPSPEVDALRVRLVDLLDAGAPEATRVAVASLLIPQDELVMRLPAAVGDYTDFYCSIEHATNVGSMFRPDNPLLPNYKHLPIGYHGRASSLVVSGTPVRRPCGQLQTDPHPPTFGPSRLLDYELEVGFWIGRGNPLGTPIPIADAADHLFGLSLVNDWSARDVQRWEYQPLGPFLAKSFATSVSPWVVTRQALAPFRLPRPTRPEGDPQPLPYLDGEADRAGGAIDLHLEVSLASARMREECLAPHRLSLGNFRNLYWTPAQMLAHHASNGCNLRPGDLFASGTVSGKEKSERGCLLELTWRGAEPITLPTGEVRRFLEDGDEVVFRGWCERPGAVRIGLGECRGIVEAALP